MPNVRIIAKGQRGDSLTKLKVNFAPSQSSTPSLMPETNSVYLFRPTEGTGELMELVGGSVAWNQLIKVSPGTRSGVTVSDGEYGVAELVGTITTTYLLAFDAVAIKAGHKYVINRRTLSNPNNVSFKVGAYNAEAVFNLSNDGYAVVTTSTSRNTSVGLTQLTANTDLTGIKIAYYLTDLTSYLNPTIADYVYSLEQSAAGSGIAWLKSYGFFTQDYIAYSAPTLQSVEATSHVTVGFNQWDEEWESGGLNNSGVPVSNTNMIRSKNFIPIIPGPKYYTHASNPATYLWYYDSGQNFISFVTNNANHEVTVPANAHYAKLRIGDPSNPATAYDHNICLNISKTTGTPKNGDYVPYVKHTTPLANITLRGIPKLSNGNLYYDGDTYEWDGTVTRKYKEVTFDGSSDEGWNVAVSGGHYRGYINISDIKPFDGSFSSISMLYKCSSFINGTWDNVFGGNAVAGMTGQNWGFGLDALSITDSAGLKTWLSSHPIELIYELATPTTESADPFTAVQTVEDGGTEEFVTTNGVPVGVVGRFANAVPMEGVDSFTVTANDGTTHTYPVTLSEEIYRGYVDMLTGEAVSDMASIAEYNGETIGEPWLSSLDEYATGTTPTNGAQVVYPITPEEVTATITGDPTELGKVTSASSTEGTVEWSAMAPLDGKCIVRVVS